MLRLRPQYFAFKIKDGLFLGDCNSPNQIEFLLSNKISTIINCAASEISIYHNLNIKIINFEWLDNEEEVILDHNDSNFQSIYFFIEEAVALAEGVLICSYRGQSRALTIITAYLIKKYKWSLYKTLQYLNTKRYDFQIRANFLKQLVAFQQRLYGKKLKNCTKNWEEEELEEQARTVKNTYVNSIRCKSEKQGSSSPPKAYHKSGKLKNQKKVRFEDFVVIINSRISAKDDIEETDQAINNQRTLKLQKKQQTLESSDDRFHSKQDPLDLILLHREEGQKKRTDSVPRNSRRNSVRKVKTEEDEQMYMHKSPQAQKRLATPYRIRRNKPERNPSDPSIQHLVTEPAREEVQVNINLNINSINIISTEGSRNKQVASRDSTNSNAKNKQLFKKSSVIFNEQKLKMYLNDSLSKNLRRKSMSQALRLDPSRRASSSKKIPQEPAPQNKLGTRKLSYKAASRVLSGSYEKRHNTSSFN